MAMDLLERYLRAVGQYLPEATRQDTLLELRANLEEQMEAQAEERQRPLSEADVADVLRAHGRPHTVAARYLPQRWLIGPGLFPHYLLTLRKALPFVLLLYLLARALDLITKTERPPTMDTIVGAALGVFPTLLLFWGSITLVYAALQFWHDRYGGATSANGTWDPTKLPPLRGGVGQYKPRSRAGRVADLVVHCLWMAYVLIAPRHPFLLIGPGTLYMFSLNARYAPALYQFYVALVVLLVVQLGVKIVALVNGSSRWLQLMEFATQVAGVAVFGILAFAREYFVPVGGNASSDMLAGLNHALSLGFRIALVCAVAGVATNGWKLMKERLPVPSFSR